MVLLTTTPRILAAISRLSQTPLKSRPFTENGNNVPPAESVLQSLPRSLEDPVSHLSLVNLSQLLLKAFPKSGSEYHMNSLLQGTCVFFPPAPPKPKPSKEYLESKARLLREQEQREYDRLLQKTNQVELDNKSEDDLSPSLVFNILLSVLLCGFAGFWATRHWSNTGLRVLLSIVAGLVVGVAEVVVYASYLRKARDARAKEVKKKEFKVFVREEPQKSGSSAEQDHTKTDVIWGKGVNGGIRRRVREQWEREKNPNS